MNLFAMKVTYPVDGDTIEELQSLLKTVQLHDAVEYDELLHRSYWRESVAGSFFVLAYDEDKDQLVGALSAFDLLGMNAYEWSLIVDPAYREIGLEEALIEGLKHGLYERSATGEMAVLYKQEKVAQLLEANGYEYSSSKIEKQTTAEKQQVDSLQLRRYEQRDLDVLAQMMGEAFGDLREETEEIVDLMKEDEGSTIWIAEQDGEVVATATTAVEGKSLWITAFTTAKEFRYKGIALQLLNWLKNYASEEGYSTLRLEVETDNPAALSLYQKAGFVNRKQFDYYIVS